MKPLSLNKKWRRIRRAGIMLCLCIMMAVSAVLTAGPGKMGKRLLMRNSDAFSDSTRSVIFRVGNGSGDGENVLQETLTYIPHRSHLYSIYHGFFGLTFDAFNREVAQTRYIDLTWPNDGELLSLKRMTLDPANTNDSFTSVSGILSDTLRPDSFDVVQRCLIRSVSDDNFAILEYTIRNFNPEIYIAGILVGGIMKGCRVMFFCDFDVGDTYADNLTGKVDSLNLVYQYSPADDYAGLAVIYPDSAEVEVGNTNNWFNYSTDARIDSLMARSFRPDTAIYDTLWETRMGDHSSFIVSKLDSALPPGESLTIAFALAIDTTLASLLSQISTAAQVYRDYRAGGGAFNQVEIPLPIPAGLTMLSVYPNPFNSSSVIEFSLQCGGTVDIGIYDILGRRVAAVFEGYAEAGTHRAVWNGGCDGGTAVPAGVYFIRAVYPGGQSLKKVVYLP